MTAIGASAAPLGSAKELKPSADGSENDEELVKESAVGLDNVSANRGRSAARTALSIACLYFLLV